MPWLSTSISTLCPRDVFVTRHQRIASSVSFLQLSWCRCTKRNREELCPLKTGSIQYSASLKEIHELTKAKNFQIHKNQGRSLGNPASVLVELCSVAAFEHKQFCDTVHTQACLRLKPLLALAPFIPHNSKVKCLKRALFTASLVCPFNSYCLCKKQ